MAELSREPRTGRLATEPADGARDQEDLEEVVERRRGRRLDIVGHRNVYFAISLLVIIPGMLSMIFRGFLLGIDFQGGTEFFFKFQNQVSLQSVEAAVAAQNVEGVVQQGGNGSFIVRTTPLDPAGQQRITDAVVSRVGPLQSGAPQEVNQVGPSVAREIVTGALTAVVAASACILRRADRATASVAHSTQNELTTPTHVGQRGSARYSGWRDVCSPRGEKVAATRSSPPTHRRSHL